MLSDDARYSLFIDEASSGIAMGGDAALRSGDLDSRSGRHGYREPHRSEVVGRHVPLEILRILDLEVAGDDEQVTREARRILHRLPHRLGKSTGTGEYPVPVLTAASAPVSRGATSHHEQPLVDPQLEQT